jgi:hypothetical protein
MQQRGYVCVTGLDDVIEAIPGDAVVLVTRRQAFE